MIYFSYRVKELTHSLIFLIFKSYFNTMKKKRRKEETKYADDFKRYNICLWLYTYVDKNQI